MKKALNQWCFPAGTEIETLLSISKKYGFDGLELNLDEPGNPGLTLESDEHSTSLVKRSADNAGIELKSLSTGLYWTSPFTHEDDSVRDKAQSILRRQLEIAHLMEMDVILVVPGIVNERTSYKDAYTRSFKSIEPLVRTAESYGVTIGIENVWNKFLLSPLEMRDFIDSFTSPFVASYFDVGNVLQFGYPEDWIRILDKRIAKVHIKDFSTSVGNISGFVPLLSGDVDWGRTRAALEDIQYDDYVTAELSPYDLHDDLLAAHASTAINRIFDLGGEAE